MRGAAIGLALLVGFVPTCGTDSITDAEWFDEARASRSCESDDDCVRLEAVCGCCFVAVAADQAERLIDLADRVACDDECSCIGFDYVVCEANLCTGRQR